MALADYEHLAARSFEEPHDADLRAAVLVCADALSQIDDPRGPLIAMEHALRDADPRRAIELRKAMHEHAAGEAAGLLAGAAPLMYSGRTLALEWRSGKLFGISVDARYLPKKTKQGAGELVRIVLGAPAASNLRRLSVRVRNDNDTRAILGMLRKLDAPPPLEELDIYTSVWPQRMTPTAQLVMQEHYPHLYYVVHETSTISLPPTGNPLRDTGLDLHDLQRCGPPTAQPARTFLGRALTHASHELRGAALKRIIEHGPLAKVFERVLVTLLQPRVIPPGAGPGVTARALPVVEALRAIGPSRSARRMLDKVASRPADYDAVTRSAAGKATELDRR